MKHPISEKIIATIIMSIFVACAVFFTINYKHFLYGENYVHIPSSVPYKTVAFYDGIRPGTLKLVGHVDNDAVIAWRYRDRGYAALITPDDGSILHGTTTVYGAGDNGAVLRHGTLLLTHIAATGSGRNAFILPSTQGFSVGWDGIRAFNLVPAGVPLGRKEKS